MALGVRGFNPIWSEQDLQGKQFDDSFWLYVLENTIPYNPAPVWHDPDFNIVWTSPIRFLANGTLPVDIFFESDKVYRLEFRKNLGLLPPSQNDPLIYEVNNYIAGTGGSTPVDSVAMSSTNQITNPQFSLVKFSSPYVLAATNPAPISVAPGWVLELEGTGTVTINRVALNSTNKNPSNAPYALRLTLTGWNSGGVHLRQRFEQNGMLWTSFSGSSIKYVSNALTARVNGAPQSISAVLMDSDGTPLSTVLAPSVVNGSWNEFTGYGQMPETNNTNLPPLAYVDYRLSLPSNVDIYLTSFQLVVQDLPFRPSFEQDSIERQVDHTFHYYKPELDFKPVPSLLTAWDFPLNPSQFGELSFTTTAKYVWDQTIMRSSVGTINVSRVPSTGGMSVMTNNANEAFYMIQYLSGAEALKTTYSKLCVNIDAYSIVHPDVIVNCYLYYSSGNGTIPALPTTIGSITNPLTGEFTLSAGNWTLVPQALGAFNRATLPLNDHTKDTKFYDYLAESNFTVADTNHNFAIVVTFAVPSSGTQVLIGSIACTPGNIPTRPAPQTEDEVLRECELYYEMSYDSGTSPFATNIGAVYASQSSYWASNTASSYATDFSISYRVSKRATPVITFYSVDGTANNVQAQLIYFNGVSSISTANVLVSSRWSPIIGLKAANYTVNSIGTAILSQATGVTRTENSAAIRFQYVLDSRLGIV